MVFLPTLMKKENITEVVIIFEISVDKFLYLIISNTLLQMEDNIFARTTPVNERFSDISPSVTMRSRNSKFLENYDDRTISNYM